MIRRTAAVVALATIATTALVVGFLSVRPSTPPIPVTAPVPATAVTPAPTTTAPTAPTPSVPSSSAPAAATGVNVLLAISDSGPCVGDSSDDASAAVMVRVEPEVGRAAALSFPNNLWVLLAGTNRHTRFAAAIDPTNPLRLVDTIFQNFTVHTDHYLSMDACGLSAIVDAVRGVPMSFVAAVRDADSGFSVPEPACRVLDGATALVYARSHRLETFDPATGSWVLDASTDNGQIARQQLFMRRLLHHAADLALGDPGALNELLAAALANATFDTEFTVDAIVQVFSTLGSIEPSAITTAKIDGTPLRRGDAEVLEADLTSEGAVGVLDRFRGRAVAVEPNPPAAETDLCARS